jgi:hypothetical protein
MRIDREYNNYYVYSSVYNNSKLVSNGACPVVWQDEVVLQGGIWKKGLTWADGNYHLYDNSGLSNADAQFIEECIYTALNESEATFDKIILEDNYKVRWCLLEEEQMRVVMDIPD